VLVINLVSNLPTEKAYPMPIRKFVAARAFAGSVESDWARKSDVNGQRLAKVAIDFTNGILRRKKSGHTARFFTLVPGLFGTGDLVAALGSVFAYFLCGEVSE